MYPIYPYLSIISVHDTIVNGAALATCDWLALMTGYMLQQNSKEADLTPYRELLKHARKHVFGKKDIDEETFMRMPFGEACYEVSLRWAIRLDAKTLAYFSKTIRDQLKVVTSVDGGFLSFDNQLFCAYQKIEKVKDIPIGQYEWMRTDSVDAALTKTETEKLNEDFSVGVSPQAEAAPVLAEGSAETAHEKDDATVLLHYEKKMRTVAGKYVDKDVDRQLDQLWLELARGNAFNIREPYFWRMKLGKTDFAKLETALKAVVTNHEATQRNVCMLRRHALPLACYIAEYYKRIWNGSDGQSNELEQLGLPANYQSIIEASGIDKDKYVYVAEESQVHMWQDSLRMLGGLPLNYIVSKGKIGNLLSSLVDVYQHSEDDDETQLDRLQKRLQELECGVGGIALTGSITKGHSIAEYIRSIFSNDFPFVAEDQTDQVFSEFKRILTEERIRIWKKFSWEWILYPDGFTIHPSLRLRFSGKDRDETYKYYVSHERMKQWGITSTPECFFLGLKFLKDGGEVGRCKKIAYFSDNGVHYVCCGFTEAIPVNAIPHCAFDKAICFLDFNGHEQIIPEECAYHSYIQVFQQQNPYLWSSCRRVSASAVAYNTDMWEAQESDGVELPVSWNGLPPTYAWTTIENRGLVLKNRLDGSMVGFCSAFGLVFEPKRIRALQYINGSEFRYFDGQVQSTIPVLFGFNYRVLVVEYDNDQTFEIKNNDADLNLEFRKASEKKFQPISCLKQISAQLIEIRVKYRGRERRQKVFYIPCKKDKWITRNIDEACAKFDIKPLYQPADELLKSISQGEWWHPENYERCISKKANLFYYHDILPMKEYDSEVIPFMVTGVSSEDFVILPVVRPRRTTKLYLDGQMIKEYLDNEVPGIPFALRHHFHLRRFDKDGIDDIRFFQKPWELNGIWSLDIFTKTPSKDDLKRSSSNLYYCTNRGKGMKDESGKKLRDFELDLGVPMGVDPKVLYKFFYWDYINPAQQLEYAYDTDRKVLNLTTPEGFSQQGQYIIFQSLKGVEGTRHYCAPIKGSSRIVNNVNAYRMAQEHGVYFHLFDMERLGKEDFMMLLLEEMKLGGMQLDDSGTFSLYRLAEELAYDWLMIPELAWVKMFDKTFGKSTPEALTAMAELKRFLKRIPWVEPNSKESEALAAVVDGRGDMSQARSSKGAINDALLFMKQRSGKSLFNHEYAERKDFLRRFYSMDSPFVKLWEKIRLQKDN